MGQGAQHRTDRNRPQQDSMFAVALAGQRGHSQALQRRKGTAMHGTSYHLGPCTRSAPLPSLLCWGCWGLAGDTCTLQGTAQLQVIAEPSLTKGRRLTEGEQQGEALGETSPWQPGLSRATCSQLPAVTAMSPAEHTLSSAERPLFSLEHGMSGHSPGQVVDCRRQGDLEALRTTQTTRARCCTKHFLQFCLTSRNRQEFL